MSNVEHGDLHLQEHVRPSPFVPGPLIPDFSPEKARDLRRTVASCPRYAPSPLRSLAGLARASGITAIDYKDESGRFGLGSFKALGGALAVGKAVQRSTGAEWSTGALTARTIEASKGVRAPLTVTCATDGNHGKSVALGARHFGARCVIFVHEHVAQERVDAIEALGAEVRRVTGTYDDAVKYAAATAEREGWSVISDTSWPGYETVSIEVMQGYLVLMDEIFGEDVDAAAPYSHVFIQAGVGGLAAAVLGYLAACYGTHRPRVVVVEPTLAPCLFESARTGELVTIEGTMDTAMAMLACAQPSTIAWDILRDLTDAFLVIDDATARAGVKLLATSPYGDLPIEAGESGAAGLGGCLTALDRHREALSIRSDSRILLIGTEGALDRESFFQSTGLTVDQWLAQHAS
ncbi:MAG: diaminopropionate ammonia-lyase [Sphingomonadales bacterium]